MKISIEKKNQLFFSPFISHYFSFSLFLFPLLSQCSQWWCNPAWWCSLAWWSHPSPWDPQHSRSLQRLTSSTQRHQSSLHHSHITLSLHHHITSFIPLYYIIIIVIMHRTEWLGWAAHQTPTSSSRMPLDHLAESLRLSWKTSLQSGMNYEASLHSCF